jgi:hypothetical protein
MRNTTMKAASGHHFAVYRVLNREQRAGFDRLTRRPTASCAETFVTALELIS